MAPANIGPVKAMVLSLDAASARREVFGLVDRDEPLLRQHLVEFARGAGVEIDDAAGPS
jgi:phosphotransferase system enzyme I (PtsP)